LTNLESLLTKEKAAQKTAGDKAAADAAKPAPAKPAAPAKVAAPTRPTPAAAPKPTASPSATASKSAPAKPVDPAVKARQDAENPFRAQIAVLEAAVAEMKGRAALREGKFDAALAELKKAGITSGEYLSRVNLAANKKDEAERLARDVVKRNNKQVVPAANLVFVLWELDKKSEAKTLFKDLRTAAAAADLDVPAFERLKPIAAELGWPDDWRTPAATPADVGVRPPLDALGPIRWTPGPAPAFELTTLDGKTLSSTQFRGRNVVYIFYLGFGCLHCTEQLKAFKPLAEEYRKAGIEIVAIATDTSDALRNAQSVLTADEKYPFEIVSNDDLSVFKKYRAYDDFEKMTLHATVLVDSNGRLRWIDVGPDPFSDAKFLLGEAKRLISLTPSTNDATAQRGSEE
jgi:peroxiredoxin